MAERRPVKSSRPQRLDLARKVNSDISPIRQALPNLAGTWCVHYGGSRKPYKEAEKKTKKTKRVTRNLLVFITFLSPSVSSEWRFSVLHCKWWMSAEINCRFQTSSQIAYFKTYFSYSSSSVFTRLCWLLYCAWHSITRGKALFRATHI